MHQLLPAGLHHVRVIGIRQDTAYTYLNFASADERTAIQRIPNEAVRCGLAEMGCELQDLQGRSCVIRVESVLAEPGLLMARAIDCQWLAPERAESTRTLTVA